MEDWTPGLARHRYNGEATPCMVRVTPDNPSLFRVRFEEPQRAVTPGQALVIYGGPGADRVLGGGWIRSAF